MSKLKESFKYTGFGQTFSRKRQRREHRHWATFLAERDPVKAAAHRKAARNG